ncbi:sialin-like [Ischnura elegans]|uniref:sialin-like n=1 Tax=Ischnura elegans TaxID=197161 RepID=UPI001ED89986|nr:sialin-like [Ischnura elegans]
MEITEFTFDIQHRPGKQLPHVDALSRIIPGINAIEVEMVTHEPTWDKEKILPEQQNCPHLKSFHDLARIHDPSFLYDEDGLLYKVILGTPDPKFSLCAPKAMRRYIMERCHDNPLAGHLGMTKTLELVRRHFFWDGSSVDTTNYDNGCLTFGVMSYEKEKQRLSRLLSEVDKEPQESLHFDDDDDEDLLEVQEESSDSEQDWDMEDGDAMKEDDIFTGKDGTTVWRKKTPKQSCVPTSLSALPSLTALRPHGEREATRDPVKARSSQHEPLPPFSVPTRAAAFLATRRGRSPRSLRVLIATPSRNALHSAYHTRLEMAAGLVLTVLLAVAFALAGFIQYEIAAAVIKFSADDYTDYVSKVGFVPLFCEEHNLTELPAVDFVEGSGSGLAQPERGEEDDYYPVYKVPLTEDRRWELNLYEAFVWGSLVGPLIGAYLVPRLGPKRVVEGGLLGASVATLLVPAAWFTTAHYALSATQGACTNMIWPAAHVLVSRWYAAAVRSTVISVYAAWTAGWAVAVLVAGPIVDSLGRDSVFYFTSLAVVCWYIAWMRYVPDAAPIPPNVSWTERRLLSVNSDEPSSALSAEGGGESCCGINRFPFKAFLLSGPVWACAWASFGYHWGQTTFLLAVTQYLQIVYGFSMSYDGVLSSLPFIGHLLCAIALGLLADHYRAHLVSTTTVRKLLVYMSHFLPGSIIFVIGFTGCDPSTPAALFVAALGISGAMPAGVYTSALEISPKYSSAVLGFVQSIGACGALASIYIIRESLYGSFPRTWTLVFGLCFVVLVASAGIFLGYGSGTVQPWNEPLAPIVTLLTFEQANSNDLANQQHELNQTSQSSGVIEQLNRKNQVFTT